MKVISKGQSHGPEGVPVQIRKLSGNQVIQTSQTRQDGSYVFSKLAPGEYIVQATHPTWTFEKAESRVKITQDNGQVGENLVVSGYDVSGKVFSEGEPIKGVNFILFSTTVKPQDVTKCDKSLVKGFKHAEKGNLLCHVTSAGDGSFVFPVLPVGKYVAMPFYKGEHITFDVVPAKEEFTVNHGSVIIKEPFQVAGFSVSGRVLESVKGNGVKGAKILIDGKEQTVTGLDGSYHLENMKTGTYTIRIIAEKIFFDATNVKVTPNTPQLPNIVASSFSLCGKVVIEKIPEGLSQVPPQRKITISSESSPADVMTIETSADGTFCSAVKRGKYIVKVTLSEKEIKAGLQLAPAERYVTVMNHPVEDVTFSQFRAKVSGTVTCIEKCGFIEVSLDPVGRADQKQIVQVKDGPKGGTFSFSDIMPGKYRATLLQDTWCWKDKTLEFEVVESDVNSGLDFFQNGYILKCSLSHEISLHFAHEKKEGSVGSFELNKGTNRFCLAQPGVYRLTPDSCHQFEQEVYTYDTSNPAMLTLSAVKHLIHGTITTSEKASDIIVQVRSSTDGDAQVTLGPLKSEHEQATKDKKDQKSSSAKGPFIYKFSYWAKTAEKLQIVPRAKELLFYPDSTDVTVSGEGCPGEVASFTAKMGVFILGKINPPLESVKVKVMSKDGKGEPLLLETGSQGTFNIGPLHSDREYNVTAEKEGYVLSPVDGELGHFKAFKLGEISVRVLGATDEPLQDVLLSLSGGNSYRSNNLTPPNGTLVFSSLSPGQYFLRPMMKEYRFEPASQMIDVLEGTTVNLVIKGIRVAFSCYGTVTSLNGEPEAGVIVEAVGLKECSQFQEESKSEQDGTFRIRGLQPKCIYSVHLKTGQVNQHIDRSAPKTQKLHVENSDFNNVRFIAFRRMNQMDISGNIITSDEFLPTLKLKLFKEDNPDAPIHTVSMSVTTFFYLPSLQIDNQKYILRMETSLSANSFDYSLPEVFFSANSTYHHFTFRFEPKQRSLDSDLTQGSFLMLPMTLLTIALAYHRKKVLPFLKQTFGQMHGMLNKQSSPHAMGEPLATEAAASKRKQKVRKT